MSKTVALIYIGPVHQERRTADGRRIPLEPGQRYQFEADLAELLCTRHPTHWQKPESKQPKPEPSTKIGD